VPGIYISYPFCSQKCTYCNFASGVFPRETERLYIDRVAREIAEFPLAWTPDTVYLGGGTPSSMDPADLARVLAAVPGKPWREATMETAPGTVTREMVKAWREAGINRVSLGVQSFVTEELKRTGRRHTAETVAHDVELLRDAGIGNINIDLIAGLPRQTVASWRESLDWVERLGAPHVSVYMLEVDEDSRLGAEILLNGKRYGASETPDDDATAAMYETAVERLAAMGVARYEISNFARPGLESLHNLKYWQLAPYIGFGADAHSFDGGRRWGNRESVDEYLRGGEREYETVAAEEKFFVGLRLMSGVVPDEREWREYAAPIQRFMDNGLLETAGDKLRLTARGVMVSNEVFQEFLNA
jgi:oxygen-independent coproporphyrinogen-3 oxidase